MSVVEQLRASRNRLLGRQRLSVYVYGVAVAGGDLIGRKLKNRRLNRLELVFLGAKREAEHRQDLKLGFAGLLQHKRGEALAVRRNRIGLLVRLLGAHQRTIDFGVLRQPVQVGNVVFLRFHVIEGGILIRIQLVEVLFRENGAHFVDDLLRLGSRFLVGREGGIEIAIDARSGENDQRHEHEIDHPEANVAQAQLALGIAGVFPFAFAHQFSPRFTIHAVGRRREAWKSPCPSFFCSPS